MSSLAPKSGANSALQTEQAGGADSRSPGSIAPAGSKRPDPLIGKVINGRFKILSLIARGGMGKVYRAEQAPLGRVCALKVLNPKYEGDEDPEFQRRFFLEASTASKLTHPNTVTIFDYGRDGDTYFIAMEYIQGRTLYRILRDEGTLVEERVARIMRQVCRSLREAHALGVIHRDMKPANIVLTGLADEADTVKVLDFGLVKEMAEDKEDLTQQGLFMGSPKYMAPEQILGNAVSAPTDVYSLGVVAYELLCGRVPFDEGASVKTLMAHVNDPPLPLRAAKPQAEISLEMEAIVMRCLAKEPEDRFKNMDELLLALTRVEGGGSLTESLRAGPLVTPPALKNPRASGVVSSASLLHAEPNPTRITPAKGTGLASSGPPPRSGSAPAAGSVPPAGPPSYPDQLSGPQVGPSGPYSGPQPSGPGPQPSGPFSGPQASGPYSGPQASGAYSGPQASGPYSGPSEPPQPSGSIPQIPPPVAVPGSGAPGYTAHPSGTPEPMAQPAELTEKPRNKMVTLLAVGLSIAVAAGVALVLTRDATKPSPSGTTETAAGPAAQPDDETHAADNETSAADSAAAKPTSTAADQAAGRAVRIVSIPAGAEVTLGNELLCRPTPCEINLDGKDAARPQKLELSLAGYQSGTLLVRPGAREASLRLSKQAANSKGGWPNRTAKPATTPAPVKPRPTATQAKPAPTASTPKGYKDSPY